MNDWLNEYRKQYPDDKSLCLAMYGRDDKPVCVRCGFDDIRALCIDHIENDGKEHRKWVGKHIYKWLIDNNFPAGFQTLCMNCNWIKYREQGPTKPSKPRKPRQYPILDVEYSKQPLSRRVRQLIRHLNEPFRVIDIRYILPMSSQESRNLRHIIHRMAKKGELERLHINKRFYRKTQKLT